MRVTLAGHCCESGDLIGENLPVQHLEKGDIVAVLSTGAYNYSMASHYNRMPNPPVIMVKADQDRVIVRRETWEDLVRIIWVWQIPFALTQTRYPVQLVHY